MKKDLDTFVTLSTILLTMYDEILLIERMAELGLNFYAISQKTHLHPDTVRKVIQTGKGHPESIRLVAKALKFKLPQIVKRHDPKTKRSIRKSA